MGVFSKKNCLGGFRRWKRRPQGPPTQSMAATLRFDVELLGFEPPATAGADTGENDEL